MTKYENLVDVPAHLLAEALVYRIFQDHMEPTGMNKSGNLVVQSVPHDDVRKIASELVNKALKDVPFKDVK